MPIPTTAASSDTETTLVHSQPSPKTPQQQHIELESFSMPNPFEDDDGYLRPHSAHGKTGRGSKSHSKTNLSVLSKVSSSGRCSSDDQMIPLSPHSGQTSPSIFNSPTARFSTDSATPSRSSISSNSSHSSNSRGSSSASIVNFCEQRQKAPSQIIKELTVEVLPALLVSVAGSICAGYILGSIQNNPAFDRIPALFIMVPVLLNLKSNTELNMSTRMSTLANLGTFNSKKDAINSMRSNMELLLLQSTVVGTCVGLISTCLSLLPSTSSHQGVWNFFLEASILMASGIGCAVLGSAAIGMLICFTVYVSHRYGVDPDNIGTPIASSFGDMSTLLILGILTSMLISLIRTPWPLALTLGLVALGLVLLRVVRSNELMSPHISKGWLPLLYAAVTSSIAGLVVEKFADRYPGMPALVPVLNGIGGNIGTVFASRLSTSLHRRRSQEAEHTLVMLILLLINIPVQVGFLAMHQFFDPALSSVNVWFIAVYTSATVVHGIAILSLARVACKYLWKHGYDPDDCVNPFITGSGDMLGTILLALVFVLA
ncbi:hypothetical protein GGI07_003840 [Coemansia sp. Benny D115]|nr:hypothetical protein GGI07_003840 [Coemansia sp. Benny D115]